LNKRSKALLCQNTTLNQYHRERLETGLRYINGAVKRRTTPRTQAFLKIHKDAYKAALEGAHPGEASRAVVQALDQVYHSAAFYLKPRLPEEHDRLMHYVRLRRLELLANYGDYLGQDLNAGARGASSEMRSAALEMEKSKSWLTIGNELARVDLSDLHKQVHTACGILGIDPNHIVWLMKEWANRNRTFYNQIRQNITDGRWARLAEQLHRDLEELPNVADDEETAANYKKVLLHIRKEYFDVISDDGPEYWFANDCARRLTEKTIKAAQK